MFKGGKAPLHFETYLFGTGCRSFVLMGYVTSHPEMLQQVAGVTHQFLSFLADVVPRGE